MRSIVIHGHFYQPPRDDPWTGTIPLEPNAARFHDWPERIERECYARVAPSLAFMSFDFGPTLLEGMEHHAPGTYAAVVAAGRAGGALAMPYHHLILPLSPRRDRVTGVRWGIADFRRRFGREPEGMWLPETAVDDETLDVLAAEGIRFTILAPHQVERAPADGLPGWYRTSGGRRSAPCTSAGGLRCVRPSIGSLESCTPCSSARVGRCPPSSSATRSACSLRAAGSSTTSRGSSR